MTHRVDQRARATRTITITALCLALAATVSCGGGEEESGKRTSVTSVAPPPPPASPLEQINLDRRVEFPESQEPSTVDIAQAVADFAAVFAKSDASSARRMMMPADQAVLDQLVERGAWSDSASEVEIVRVVSLTEKSNGQVEIGLAVQQPSGAYLIGWRGENTGGGWSFTALPLETKAESSAKALDGVDLDGLKTVASGL